MDKQTRLFAGRIVAAINEVGRLLVEIQNKIIETIREYAHTKNQGHRPQPPAIIKSEVEIPEAVRREYYSYQKRANRWQGGPPFVVALLTLFVLVAYTVFSFQQWDAMTFGIEQTQMSLRALRRQARAAEVSADIASQTLFQLKRDLRPYIGLMNDVGGPVMMEPPRAVLGKKQVLWTNVHYTNYGKIPALNVRIKTELMVGNGVLGRRPRFTKVIEAGAIAPTQNAMFTGTDPVTIITPDAFAGFFTQSDNSLILRGKIEYSDSSGEPFETGFCLLHLRQGPIAFCGGAKENYMK